MSDKTTKIIVDTNVWIDFLRQPEPELRLLIKQRRVLTCQCVIGEVMVGSPKDRLSIRQFLLSLPLAAEATFGEVLTMIESRRLHGIGLQWNDVILLAAAKLSSARLWTRDKRLAKAAEEFGINWAELSSGKNS
jgi:hypothetical protein